MPSVLDYLKGKNKVTHDTNKVTQQPSIKVTPEPAQTEGKGKRGRPRLGTEPLTSAEKQKRYRERKALQRKGSGDFSGSDTH